MYFDTHAHYDDDRFDEDRHELLASMPGRGVSLILNPGCDLETSETAVAFAEKYPYVYAAVGIHPQSADTASPETLDRIAELAKHPKVKAIGEIGLDYHYEYSPRETQRRVFRRQLELARKLGLPVIIHERDACADCLEIVKDFQDLRGVFHCYSGSLETAEIIVKMGWSISFTGVVTFKNARRAQQVAAWLPEDRIMIETDCPYMAPEPRRGARNDSSLLEYIAEKIAELRGVSKEEVARITMENGKRFFDID